MKQKSDLTHPIWFVVNKNFTYKCIYICTAVYCTWDNILSQAILPVKQLFTNKTKGFDHVKFVFLFFVMLKIDDRYSNGWNKLVFEDQFGNSWQK